MSNIHPACKPVLEAKFNVLTVKVEKDGSKFTAKLHTVVQRPYTKEISLVGPLRDTRPEAIKDGMELGKRYVLEGEAGARTVLLRLKKRKWSPVDLKDVDEAALDGFVLPGLQGNNQEPRTVEEKLLPPGEGWARYSDELLVHPLAVPPVYFATSGQRAGQYLCQTSSGTGESPAWEAAPVPHVPRELPLRVAAASASSARKGGKLDRAVLLPDITRIARLALKMPLSFVDRPASAYAVFQGLRSAETAQWCAENFHKKLLQRLARKIHSYEVEELQAITKVTLEELDEEVLRSAHAFSGCSALIALVLGDQLVVTGVGQVRAVLLQDGAAPRALLTCSGSLDSPEESKRISEAGGVIRGGLVSRSAEDLDDASRILSAASVFDVLMLPDGGPADGGQVRSSYRKLALRVHPDKVSEGDVPVFQAAFARLETARERVESMFAKDPEACRQLCRLLRGDAHTRAGATALLGLSEEPAATEADRACRRLVESLSPLQGLAAEHEWAVAACHEAVDTLQRVCAPEALPRQEALLREGVPTGRALGVRDLRRPRPLVLMAPESASWQLPAGTACRLAALSGAVATCSEAQLAAGSAPRFARRPRASALRWCLDVAAAAAAAAAGRGGESSNGTCSSSSSNGAGGAGTGSAICLSLVPASAEAGSTEAAAGTGAGTSVTGAGTATATGTAGHGGQQPSGKRPRAWEQGPEGTVRVRHILLRHRQSRPDPMARREATRSAQEAEEAALAALEELLATSSAAGDVDRHFLKLCRELSDCQSAAQPGALAGDLGWLARGQCEQVLEEVIWALGMREISDILLSSRGVHIIMRLA